MDFQAMIDTHLRLAARRVADDAVFVNNQDCAWSYGSHCWDDHILVQVWNSDILQHLSEVPSMRFELAGCSIDAFLLKRLHSEVAAWFLKIKAEVSPCKD